jgi:hypothetical protein
MLDETLARPSSLPWEQLHIAQTIHEAVYITHLLTARFALGSGKKKAHPVSRTPLLSVLLTEKCSQTFKPLRAKAIALLDHAARAISKIGEDEITPEVRRQWLATRRGSAILDEVSKRRSFEMAVLLTDTPPFCRPFKIPFPQSSRMNTFSLSGGSTWRARRRCLSSSGRG